MDTLSRVLEGHKDSAVHGLYHTKDHTLHFWTLYMNLAHTECRMKQGLGCTEVWETKSHGNKRGQEETAERVSSETRLVLTL